MAATTSTSGKVAYSPLPEIYGHSRKVYALEFNANGTFLASGSNDRSIRVWSIGSNVRTVAFQKVHASCSFTSLALCANRNATRLS